ncbi:Uncharacterised protein [Sphingobacterium multivorum]|uniref:Uncharacterized protein n=1 Tax=Sphingobacterium multivorum TaxID=28454 RepID=A0A2X2IR12_SPHMU|nr:Uncharacterised protein [Sphingobacterium multivorum]
MPIYRLGNWHAHFLGGITVNVGKSSCSSLFYKNLAHGPIEPRFWFGYYRRNQ